MSPLEMPLEVRKEMENRLAPSQGCRADGKEPQTSASPEHRSLREQCAVLHCHEAIKSAMLTA